ncbi:hypothetical protein QOZ92_003109 [Paeniclostridium ghonii]|uniref:Uncharacterized protein n=1 Tax=Paraclostridium ghonii TaxID=29358 RepID=A0ABU0N4Z0_9FIRM|nr:hypothetical protein [Paeniclostridium ghonii]
MKFIKRPLTKFNEGYCFCFQQCTNLCSQFNICDQNSGCVNACTNNL